MLTLFLLTLTTSSPAQQLTNADVSVAVRDLKDVDAGVRANAARRLVLWAVKMKTLDRALVEAVSPALIEALKDPDSKVRHRSLTAYGILWNSIRFGPEMKAAVPALAALLKDDYEDTRLRATYTLAGIGPDAEAAIPALTEAANDQSARVRDAVRSALKDIRQPTAADIPALVIKLRDNNAQVRQQAVRSLQSLGAKASPAIGPLLETLKDQNAEVRFLAANTLNDLIETQGDAEPFIKPFIDLLKDPEHRTRWEAASGLGKIGPKARAAVPALTAALSDDDRTLRKYVLEALRSIGWDNETTTKSLIKLLKDPSFDVRHAAARTLSRVEVGSSVAVPVLIKDLKRNERIASSAVWALLSYDARAKDAVPALAEMLGSNLYSRQRAGIARLIGKVGPAAKPAIPFLIKSLNDRQESVRIAVAVALVQIEPESESRIEPALLKMARAKINGETEPASYVSSAAGLPGPGVAPPPRQDEAGSYFHQGKSLYRQGYVDEAIENYTKAIEFDPQYADAYHQRAEAYRGKGDHTAAIADFTKAIEVDSEYLQMRYYVRGVAQLDNRNYDPAIADFTKVIELDNYSAEAYYSRGLAHYRKKNYDAAMVDFDRALLFVPPLIEVYEARAKLKLEQGNLAGALADFDSVIQANPRDAMHYDRRNEALKDQGKLEAAENFYRAALRERPDDTELLNRLGYFLVGQNKNLDEALQLIKRAVTTQPANPIFLHSLGWASFKLARHDEALNYLRQSVERDPEWTLSQEHLGDVYEQLGKKKEAHAAWTRALFLTTDTDSQTRLKGKLNLVMRL